VDKARNFSLCKALMKMHNTSMTDDQNKQPNLFRVMIVPPTPHRDPRWIEEDLEEARKGARYDTQLIQKMNLAKKRAIEAAALRKAKQKPATDSGLVS